MAAHATIDPKPETAAADNPDGKPLPAKKAKIAKKRAGKGSKKAHRDAEQIQQHKKTLLEALESTLGIVSTACKKANLDRGTYYRYFNADAEFAAAVKDIENVALDFAESHLHKQIAAGVPASTIFYLKTKGRGRGYIERHEVTGADGGPIETHDLSNLSIDDLLKLKELNAKINAG